MNPLWKCEVTEEPVLPHECLQCARTRRILRCPVRSPGLLKALARSLRDDAGLEAVKAIAQVPIVRISGLTGCRRKTWYDIRESRPLEKPSDMWARLRGVVFHRGLENGDAGEEMRLFVRIAGAIVAGRVDHYDETNETLYDYKTVNTWKRLDRFDLPKESHVRQMHAYVWLLHRHGKKVRRVSLVYLTMGEVRIVDVRMPDLKAVEQEIREAVKAAIADTPPPPVPREEWECRYCPWSRCPAHPAHTG